MIPTGIIAQDQAMNSVLPQPQSCVMSGQFTQTKRISGLPAAIESSGVFFHDCKRGLIWKTTAPISEALIINQQQKVYRSQGGELQAVSSRAGKMISRLMLSMLSTDQTFLYKHFSVQKNPDQPSSALEFSPKTKRFKRALQSIKVNTVSQNSPTTTTSDSPPEIALSSIEIQDRANDVTRITITDQVLLADDASCATLAAITQQECGALYPQENNAE